jgi:D-lactate dehydrogenase
MNPKIFFYTLRPYDELGYAQTFRKQFGIDFDFNEGYPTFENAVLAAGYDTVSVTPCYMGRDMVERFHDLGVKHICCRSIGFDHVDIERAHELGMRVSNVDYPANGVANYAIMLMMASLRRFGHIQKRVELQDYSLQGKMGRDLSTCTVGVIGTGRIGRTVLKHLSAFGCRLLAYDLYPNEEVAQYAEYVSLDTLLAESDVITLHTNATDENHHLINAETIAKMKDGVTIVNTARGKLIDSDALIAALESGKVGGAALDVLENENGLYYYNLSGQIIPNQELALLRSFPNVILSPHTAFYTDEDVECMVRGIFESTDAFVKGEATRHEVGKL